MTTYTLIPFAQLTSRQRLAWDELQRTNPAFNSPYFRHEFMAAMHAVGYRVEVLVMEEAEQIVGLLPFERTYWNIGRPVGGTLSDFHGLLKHPDQRVDWQALLHAGRLRGWEYSSCVPQADMPGVLQQWQSPFIDLSAGFKAYCEARKQTGSETIGKTIRKARRLEKEHGLRFEVRNADPNLMAQLLAWKSQQYSEQGIPIQLAALRIPDLWKILADKPTPPLAGCLSVLWAGSVPIALSYSLLSFNAAHCWFVGYDHHFARYSPGLILLLQLAEQLAAEGIERLHLGRGEERFKTSLATGSIAVAEGTIGASSLTTQWLTTYQRTKLWVKASPIQGAIRWLRSIAPHSRGISTP